MSARDQGIDDRRWKVIPRTLCLIRHGSALLLMQRGLERRVFPGRYNGVGGHIERGEDPLRAALREIAEETGLRPDQLRGVQLRGICHIDAGEATGILLFVFSADATTRDVQGDGREGSLHWVDFDALDTVPLVPDLPLFIARVFGPAAASTPFFARVGYDAHGSMILEFAENSS